VPVHVGKLAPCEFVFGRGRRSPDFLLRQDERDRYLVEAARCYPGQSDREIARQLRLALARYRDGRWRRDRSEYTCPAQHRGKLTEVLYFLLRVRDAVPSETTIRRALAIRDPRDVLGFTI
jgi:hypothetical protein